MPKWGRFQIVRPCFILSPIVSSTLILIRLRIIKLFSMIRLLLSMVGQKPNLLIRKLRKLFVSVLVLFVRIRKRMWVNLLMSVVTVLLGSFIFRRIIIGLGRFRRKLLWNLIPVLGKRLLNTSKNHVVLLVIRVLVMVIRRKVCRVVMRIPLRVWQVRRNPVLRRRLRIRIFLVLLKRLPTMKLSGKPRLMKWVKKLPKKFVRGMKVFSVLRVRVSRKVSVITVILLNLIRCLLRRSRCKKRSGKGNR